jgi:3-oxoacyl-(acyl-carrier-protein) synthase
MMFTVTGLNAIGAVLLDCSTVVDAMKEALDLLRSGYVDVLIADGTGLQYTPAEFMYAFG